MYQCPNCAGNLKFDIKAQMFSCERCETLVGVGRVEKEGESENQEYFETTVYSCPQCGGEILGDDISTTTACSYCGASVLMTGRIRKCKRPKYIIPFQQTKEDCQKAYKEMMKGAFFVSDEFKAENQTERFRAMYVPYWICNMGANQAIEFEGVRYSQQDKYRITHHVGFETRLLSKFQGLTLEASLAFPDRLSTQIEPFRLSEKKAFTTEYLNGFYTDANDVEIRDYEQIAHNIAIEACCKKFGEMHSIYEFEENAESTTLKEAADVHYVEADLALFPVWFWFNRKKDQVAYGVMNGQTGKLAVELPIDKKKFLAASLLVSLPFMLFFGFLFTINSYTLLALLGFTALFLGILVDEQTTQVLEHTFHEDFLMQVKDKESGRKKRLGDAKWILVITGLLAAVLLDKLQNLVWNSMMIGTKMEDEVLFLKWYNTILTHGPSISKVRISHVLVFVSIGIFICLGRKMKKNYQYDKMSTLSEEAYKKEWKKKLLYLIKPALTVIIAIVALLINSASSNTYFLAIVVGIGLLLWIIWDLIIIRNKLMQHSVPEFENIGVEER